ncbi:hypothetical protein VTK73DRAFT_8485 [Phialemonium thermophilum]|uniref:Uncharacterized protein n=1 Tax=Phialemonium thermophilum TaxID=223376 RepID=A0ABR3W848_9PEZI
MKLVSSNDPAAARDTIREALAAYDRTARVSNAVPILTRLRGIGPATASLLLAVHDPDRVVFFADEAFEWLCATPDTEGGGGGTKAPAIKYNLAECVLLNDRAKTLRDRLGVRAVDVERVAFALLRQPEPREGSDAKRDVPNGDDEQAKQQMIGGRLASKRKLEPEESGGSAKGSPLRRSKRNVR